MFNPWEQKFRPGSPAYSNGLNITKCSFHAGPWLKNHPFKSKPINSKIPTLLSRLPANHRQQHDGGIQLSQERAPSFYFLCSSSNQEHLGFWWHDWTMVWRQVALL